MKLKVLSYNVHKLFDITGRKYFLSALKDILSKMDLDLVFLQEITGVQPAGYETAFDNDPLEHLADSVWDHFVYGKNAISSKGHHGNAILSKYPFVKWENFDISNHKLERRGFLLGHIEVEKQLIALGCTHLDLTGIGRKNQIGKIDKILREHTDELKPTILCGDFNDWTGKTSIHVEGIGLESTSSTFLDASTATFPSFYPVLSLDRIFFRNTSCKHIQVLSDDHWKKLSDHLPLYAEFEI